MIFIKIQHNKISIKYFQQKISLKYKIWFGFDVVKSAL